MCFDFDFADVANLSCQTHSFISKENDQRHVYANMDAASSQKFVAIMALGSEVLAILSHGEKSLLTEFLSGG